MSAIPPDSRTWRAATPYEGGSHANERETPQGETRWTWGFDGWREASDRDDFVLA